MTTKKALRAWIGNLLADVDEAADCLAADAATLDAMRAERDQALAAYRAHVDKEA